MRAAVLLMVLLASAALPACQDEARTGDQMHRTDDSGGQAGRPGGELRDINAVMADHVDRLMAMDGVTGVAISETPDGVPCIMILVRELTDERRSALPERIEGHPTCLFESGEIRPM